VGQEAEATHTTHPLFLTFICNRRSCNRARWHAPVARHTLSMVAHPPAAADQLQKDEEVLRELGYKQVLYRTWGTFTTVTIAISAMSVLTSISGGHRLVGAFFGGCQTGPDRMLPSGHTSGARTARPEAVALAPWVSRRTRASQGHGMRRLGFGTCPNPVARRRGPRCPAHQPVNPTPCRPAGSLAPQPRSLPACPMGARSCASGAGLACLWQW